MASLTDYLNGPSGAKPVITTEVEAPDIFGAAARFTNAVISAQPSAADKARAASAANEARTDAATDEYALGASDIMRGYVVPEDIGHAINKTLRLQKAGVSTLQIEAELAKLEKRVLSKYPDQAAEVFKYANDAGLDSARFRSYTLAKEQEDLEVSVVNEAFKTYSALLTKEGVDISAMSRMEIIQKGTEVQRVYAAFDWSVKQKEELRNQQTAQFALEDQNDQRQKRSIEENERVFTQSARSVLQVKAAPQLAEISRLLNEVVTTGDPEREKLFKATVEKVLISLEAQEKQMLAQYPMLSAENGNLIKGDFKNYQEFLQSMLTGDLSANSKRVSTVAAFLSQAQADAVEIMPNVMTLVDIFGQAAAEKTLPDLSGKTPGLSTRVNDEVVDFIGQMLGKKGARKGSTWIQGILDTANSYNPSDAARLQAVSPSSYAAAVNLSALSLPDIRKELISNKSPQAAQQYIKNMATVVQETMNLPNTMSSDKQIKAVLKTLPVGETLLALDAYEAAGGSPESADSIRNSVAFSYSRALNSELMRQKSAMSLFETTGMERRAKDGGTAIRFNTETGLFESSPIQQVIGRATLGDISDKSVKAKVGELNMLVNAIAKLAEDSGQLPPGMSSIATRGYIVDGIGGKENFDAALQTAIDANGWPQTNPMEVLADKTATKKANGEEKGAGVRVTIPFKSGSPEDDFTARLKKVDEFASDLLARPLEVGNRSGGKVSGALNPEKISPRIEEYKPIISEKAAQYGVPEELIIAMMDQESRGQKDAVSPVGAQGLLQLMPNTAKELGVTDPFDPTQNIDGGVRYMKQKLDAFNGDVVLALMSYNWGEGRVKKWVEGGRTGPVPQETVDYVEKILGRFNND